MCKSFAAFAIACCLVYSNAGIAAGSQVDLNAPGMLESLRRDKPGDYEKIREILASVLAHRDDEVPRWIQTAYDGRDVSYKPFLYVTFPAKRHLGFTLGDTRYQALITLDPAQFHAIPAR